MPQVKRILVPIDFSEPSGDALRYAIELARRFDSRLIVLHVWEPPRFMGPEVMFYPPERSRDSIIKIIQEQAQKQTDDFLAERLAAGAVRIDSRVEPGIPYATIIDVAEAEDIDLIVMGTHGRSGLSHFFLGSVAEKVVRYAPCPVLTIRQRREKEPRDPASPNSDD